MGTFLLKLNSGRSFRPNYKSGTGKPTEWNITMENWRLYSMWLTESGYVAMNGIQRIPHHDFQFLNSLVVLDYSTGKILKNVEEYSNDYRVTDCGTIEGESGDFWVCNSIVGDQVLIRAFQLPDLIVDWGFATSCGSAQVLPLRKDMIISTCSGKVARYDATQAKHLNDTLKAVWEQHLSDGTVMYHDGYVYFKKKGMMVKVDVENGNITIQSDDQYKGSVYSNYVISEEYSSLLYVCGLPPWDDRCNFCAVDSNTLDKKWNVKLRTDNDCYVMTLSKSEKYVYVQCTIWPNHYYLYALEVDTGNFAGNISVEVKDKEDDSLSMSAVVLKNGYVVFPIKDRVLVYDETLNTKVLELLWDSQNIQFAYQAMVADVDNCFAFCLWAYNYDVAKAHCVKKCLT